jgi:hypothetical protein
MIRDIILIVIGIALGQIPAVAKFAIAKIAALKAAAAPEVAKVEADVKAKV